MAAAASPAAPAAPASEPAPPTAGRARERKPKSDEQRRREKERRRTANETPALRAKREARNARRRVGGDQHNKLTLEARIKRKTRIFNKRHAANPGMRTNSPRRKFKNAHASWTNCDDVYKLRHDFAEQARVLEAMTRRAADADARATAADARAEAAEARAEAAEAQIKAAGSSAERAAKKRRGIPLTTFENFLEAQAGEAPEAERKKLAQVEAKYAEAMAADAKLREWFEETGLAELTQLCNQLPARNQLARFFKNA